ncbi:hypothetical protein B0I35DRAFT_427345 [Stachybotrys elegans]|uniref:Uncharacterized protein n=1 Tax=Stachybotrys elegans TaxID=80388 RepID=A0A8K0WTW0_9HYPO|nr:hypothetical protein B0I35DRAFT_427345 [Stachybotrys elegans]
MTTEDRRQQNVAMVAEFISTEAASFHGAFGSPSRLNTAMTQFQRPDVNDLWETLHTHQTRAAKYVDFIQDVNKCTWDNVHEELRKAQEAAIESEGRGKNMFKKIWRRMGVTSSILAPGLAAIPDELCVLNGGLAVIFSLARHSELNRDKILAAFESVPNIIEMAMDKARTLQPDPANPKSVDLHRSIQDLQNTLLKVLPVLIDRLLPGTFWGAFKSPFAGYKIDQILDTVRVSADRVRVCAESVLDEIIVDSYAASKAIKAQLDEVIQMQKEMRVSMAATHGRHSQTHLLRFLMEQLNMSYMGNPQVGDQTDFSERGTALSGYVAEDILKVLDINHLRIISDSSTVMRRGKSLPPQDIEKAACVITEPQVQDLLENKPVSNVVLINGHFDRTQMGKISPLSFVCTMISDMLRRLSQSLAPSSSPTSPTSPQSYERATGNVVLEYYCALHTTDDDDIRGPQGMIRCLAMQLILSMLANKWIGESEALHLPHLRDGEEEMLAQRDLGAICRLFTALVQLIPDGVSIYCMVDGWSAYEREELWQADCEEVLCAFSKAVEIRCPQGGAAFKLLLTSPTVSRSLDGFVPPSHRVSLRSRAGRESRWRGAGRGGLMSLARVATMPDGNVGFPVRVPQRDTDQ